MAKKHRDPLRMPPQTTESEKALLGALMIRPEGISEAVDVLSADAFYSEKHRIIYRAMLALFGKNEPIDIESVRAKLQDQGQLEQVGGVSYFAELVSRRARREQCAPLCTVGAKKIYAALAHRRRRICRRARL